MLTQICSISLMFFAQQLSGAIFLSVAQNLFEQRLDKNLAGISGLNARNITSNGATELRKVVPLQELPVVLVAYNDAIKRTFILATIMGALVIIGALLMEWRSVLKKQGPTSNPNPNPDAIMEQAIDHGDIDEKIRIDAPQSSGGGSDRTAIHVEQADDGQDTVPTNNEAKFSTPSEAESAVSR